MILIRLVLDRGAKVGAALLLAVALVAMGPLSSLLGAGPLVAQDTPSDTLPHPLEPIDVTVTRSEAELRRLPYAVSVSDWEDLQAERQLSMKEALEDIPGVFVQDRRNFSLGDRLTIRGVGSRAQFGVRGIQVVADGIPLTMPDGQATLTNLDLSSAGRVEVIRGPASALYGNAAGGVLAYRTEGFAPNPLSLFPEVMVGSDGFVSARAKASGSAGGLDYLANGRYTEVEGFRQHSRAEMYRANLVTAYRFSDDTRLRGVANFFRMPFGENPSTLDRETAMNDPRSARGFIVSQGAGEENTQGQIGLSLLHHLSQGELEVAGWGVRRTVWNPIPGRIIDLSRHAGGLRAVYRSGDGLAGLPLRLVTGIDAAVQDDGRLEFENEGVPEAAARAREGSLLLDQDERVANVGPFAELSLEAGGWRLTVAGRYDVYDFSADDEFLADGDDSGDRTLTHFSPMAGIGYSPAEWVGAYANFATAFETPTLSELSNRPGGGGGLNPGLEPAVIESFEAGVKGRVDAARLRYDVAVYHAEVEDALIPFQGPTEEVFFRNAGRLNRDGVEVQLGWLPHPDLETRVAYAFQDFTFEEFETEDGDFSGNREPGVPQHRVFTGATYRAPFGLTSEVNVEWVDAYPVNDANTASNWSYRVVDLRLSAEMRPGRWTLRPFLGVDNLFDERYNASVVPNAFGDRFYEPAPGTSVYAGLSIGGGVAGR